MPLPGSASVPGVEFLSPEARLIFRSADVTCQAEEFATLAAAVRDWARVLYLADREFATLNLWRTLEHSLATVPAEVADRLRMGAMATDLRMQYLSRRLRETVRILTERGVPFVLLKGGAVGAMTDPTFRMRPMRDVDILVHPADVARASEALVAAGWPLTTDPVLLKMLKDAHHLPHFVDPQIPGMRVELHVALLPSDRPFSFDDAELWRDAVPAPAPFTGALLPSPAHVVLHICIHFAWQHVMQLGAWQTIRALSVVTATPTFDWDGFVRTAQDAKALTACYWTLRLAKRLGGIRVPNAVLDRLAPPTPEMLERPLERHFVAGIVPGEGPVCPSVWLARALWRVALRPAWSGHSALGRYDPERGWERALGTFSRETRPARFARHVAGYRSWWSFLSRTLFG